MSDGVDEETRAREDLRVGEGIATNWDDLRKYAEMTKNRFHYLKFRFSDVAAFREKQRKRSKKYREKQPGYKEGRGRPTKAQGTLKKMCKA